MSRSIAGIDVHKRMLMVVWTVAEGEESEGLRFERRRFGTTRSELLHLLAWLSERDVSEAVMESTAQYWRPVWQALEGHMRLYLAQAWSNRAPRGKKTDFKDAERLVRRYRAGELTLSFVPDAEQRQMRAVMRRRTQLTRDRVRTHNQVESLLEETGIKLSSVVTDLLGATGLRMLTALASGAGDAQKLAALADARVRCPRDKMIDALTGTVTDVHRMLLKQHLETLTAIDRHLEELARVAAELTRQHAAAVARLIRIPGIRTLSAQQIVSEVGAGADAFPSAPQFASWIGVCPGRNESAGENHSSRCAKGNMYLRRTLCQAAQAAVRTKNSYFEQMFRRLVPRLGFTKAIWAIAHRLAIVIWKILHERVDYVERGLASTPQAIQRRLQRIRKELRNLGYSDELKPLQPTALEV